MIFFGTMIGESLFTNVYNVFRVFYFFLRQLAISLANPPGIKDIKDFVMHVEIGMILQVNFVFKLVFNMNI